MRKKSHISLAKYIINNMGTEELIIHKKAFYIGSILPDCVPSFITKRHSIDDTFETLKNEIQKITEKFDVSQGMNSYYCRHLGVVTHYIADYFTFPHNKIFKGTIKEHCSYENDLKKSFRDYVRFDTTQKERDAKLQFRTVEEICKFITFMHKEYLEAKKVVKVDCEYIVRICHEVVDAILLFFETIHETIRTKSVAIA